MWSTEKSGFCGKYIKNSRNKSKKARFRLVFGVSHTVRIDGFSYEIDMFGNLSIYCQGEKHMISRDQAAPTFAK